MVDPRSRYSLRRRLTLTMGGGVVAVMAVLTVGLWNYAAVAANQTYDLLLEGAAIAILEGVTLGPAGIAIDIPPSALETLGLARDDRVFYRVFTYDPAQPNTPPQTLTLTGEGKLPLPPGAGWAAATRNGGEVFFDAPYSEDTARFILRTEPLPGLSRGERLAVEVGQTRIARDALWRDMMLKGVAGLAALAVVSLVLLRLGINQAMRPLSGVEAAIRGREPTDFTPLEAGTPREIETLIQAINGFMSRLATSRDNVQTFIADVAHQMRSALATLDGRLAHALEATDPAELRRRTRRARDNSRQAVELTNQMLSHAMVIHRADSRLSDRVDLVELVRATIEDMVRVPHNAQADIEVDIGTEPAQGFVVAGDALSLREALVNLIGNAIRHGGPSARVRLTLVSDPKAHRLLLGVEDDGPGIAEAEMGEIRARFVARGPTAGTGLGLAIVEAVAHSHGGTLHLGRSSLGGLSATLDLPPAPPSGPAPIPAPTQEAR